MPRRNWFKVWPDPLLSGTLRTDEYMDLDFGSIIDSDEDKMNVQRALIRSIWIDLLALAADGKYGDIGDIKMTERVGYTDEQIADILNIPLPLWLWAKTALSDNEDPDDNRITVNGGNIIRIINWLKYQSDYQRQKPYRESQKKESSKERKQNLEEEGNFKDTTSLIDTSYSISNDIDKELRSRSRSENCNFKLQDEVTIESYKEKLQSSHWLLLLFNTFPFFLPELNWIHMIERAWKDIDLESMTTEFISFWKGKNPKNIESTFIESLRHARENGKFKARNKGKYDHLIQR